MERYEQLKLFEPEVIRNYKLESNKCCFNKVGEKCDNKIKYIYINRSQCIFITKCAKCNNFSITENRTGQYSGYSKQLNLKISKNTGQYYLEKSEVPKETQKILFAESKYWCDKCNANIFAPIISLILNDNWNHEEKSAKECEYCKLSGKVEVVENDI